MFIRAGVNQKDRGFGDMLLNFFYRFGGSKLTLRASFLGQ